MSFAAPTVGHRKFLKLFNDLIKIRTINLFKRNTNILNDHTCVISVNSPWINLGGVQLIPTATTLLHDSATEAHSRRESPLTTLMPSLELKENHAGSCMFSSSKSSA